MPPIPDQIKDYINPAEAPGAEVFLALIGDVIEAVEIPCPFSPGEYEITRFSLSGGIKLGGLIHLDELIFDVIHKPQTNELYLKGKTEIGDTRLSFSAGLTNGTLLPLINIDVSSEDGSFPTFGDLMQFVFKGSSMGSKFTASISSVVDVTPTALTLTFDYVHLRIEHVGFGAIVKLGAAPDALEFNVYFSPTDPAFAGSLKEPRTFWQVAKSFGVKYYPQILEKLAVESSVLHYQTVDESVSFRAAIRLASDLKIKGLTFKYLEMGLEYTAGKWAAVFFMQLILSDTASCTISGELGSDSYLLKGGVTPNDGLWNALESTGFHIPDFMRKVDLNSAYLEYGKDIFAINVAFTVYDNVKITLNLDFSGTETKITGTADWDGNAINLAYFSEKQKCNLLYGDYKNTGKSITLTPEFLGIDTKISLQEAALALYNTETDRVYSFACMLESGLDFSHVPLVGKFFESGGGVAIDGITVGFNTAKYDTLPAGMPGIIKPKAGFSLSADVKVNGEVFTEINIDGANQEPPPQLESYGVNDTERVPVLRTAGKPVKAEIKWFNVNKNLGVVRLMRLGAAFEAPALTLLIDGGITLGCFKCDLIRMGVNVNIDSFKPEFNLDGITMSYTSSALSVIGAITKGSKSGMKYYYSGGVSVLLTKYGFVAATSIGETQDGKFVFSLYFTAHVPIIVAPAVTIIGINGAFGYNELMRAPAVREVDKFPLVTGDITALEAWKKPSAGDYWGAAGIEFNVSKLLNGKLVLLAKFGHELEFDLIGKADITLPMKATIDKAYLYAEINILASLKPREGVFSLTALLSENSFLLSRQCKLTGGLAFYMWFGDNPHSGEFVFTLGGYHPAFRPPAHYPVVPRVGFLWNISKEISVKGEAYLAITPSCVMAGGRLDAVYQSGPVRAWFVASADFLMTFHPFNFDAMFRISVGASVRIKIWKFKMTFSYSVGADLHLYGPPTGGTATIHISVLTFTVSFGAKKSGGGESPLNVDDFKTLLPDKLHGISVAKGLIGEADKGGKFDVQAFGAMFYVSTAIPAGKINIRPMNQIGLSSQLKITIKDSKGNTVYDNTAKGNWILSEIKGNLPQALWGEPLKYANGKFMLAPKTPSADIVPNQTIGYLLEPPKPEIGDEARFKIARPSMPAGNSVSDAVTTLSLWSYYIPPIPSGDYTFSTVQNVAGLDASAQMGFTVKAHGEITARYPDKNQSGEFGKCLPHVIFANATYPFEKKIGSKNPEKEPWIVLLTLDETEFSNFSVSGNIITFFKGDFIRGILPSRKELSYFAHARDTDGTGSAGAVFSCRFPREGCENYVCLLALDNVDIENIPGENVKFTLLDSWKFYATAETAIGFEATVNALSKSTIAKSITLPKGDGKADYHGLFVPPNDDAALINTDAPRFKTSSEAIAGNDVSLACAFENARLKLLADNKTLRTLFSLRSQISSIAASKVNAPVVTADGFYSGLMNDFLSAADRKIELDKIKADLPNSAADTSAVIGRTFDIPRDKDGNPTNEAVTFAEAVYGFAMQTADVAAMLFPDKSVIPNESIRFFHIDKNIVSAAIDGALSVGVESEYEEEINNVLYKYVSGYVFNKLKGELTGFVLNSAIFEKWVDTEVYAFDAGGTELALFETRSLSGTLRLYIYSGVISAVILREPPHTLCSGLTSDGKLMVKSDGGIKYVPLDIPDNRTVSVAETINRSKANTAAQFGLDWLHIPEPVKLEVSK